MAEELRLHYKNSIIHYYKFGSGPAVLFCFHGYGNSAADFLFLEKYLGRQYTVYTLDFPFHGSTIWKEGLLFTDKDVMHILMLMSGTQKKFSLLAYSMGGRVALHLLHEHPDKINSLVLIAPDGLHTNFWYQLVTRTQAGNFLFRRSMQNPGWIYKMMAAGERLKVYNKNVLQLAGYYLHNKTNRDLLYKRWITMRRFKPDVQKVIKSSAKYNIPVKVIFGADDYVIPEKYGSKLKGAKNITMQTIPGGHFLIKERYAAYIVKMLSAE